MSRDMLNEEIVVLTNGECYDEYFYGYANTGTFYIYNAQTGELLQSFSGATPYFPTEISYDYPSNTMYSYAEGVLYIVNLSMGVCTSVATLSTSEQIFALAVNLEGIM